MCKIFFKDGTQKVVDKKQLSFILGIKDIKEQVYTYKFI
jgi:hypothetical protein|nr:MAG TPA: hypothetical protein [Caudoviricetes sp.]